MAAIQQMLLSSGFSPASISGLAAWYDAKRISSLWQDSTRTTAVTADAQTVGAWDDLSGNGRHLIQATSASEPTYRATGTYLDFDGSNDSLQVSFTLNHPCTVFLVANQQTWTAANRIFNGTGVNVGLIRQTFTGASPEISLFNGSAQACTNNGLSLTTWGVLTAVFNGASSALRVDGNSEVTGSPGTSNLDGICLASVPSLGGAFWDGFLGEVIVYSGALSSTNQDSIRAYLKQKWGTP